MLLRDLLNKVDIIACVTDLDMQITGVSCDSRAVRKGELFVAIKGFKSDGHDFIKQAIDNGAVCVLSERIPESDNSKAATTGVPYVVTADTRKSLALVAAAWYGYPAEKLKVVGVTGTNGKTTVTNLIKHMIEICGEDKVGLIGTNMNMIGDKELPTAFTTPESIEIHRLLAQMVDEGCRYAVMEVSSHAISLSRVYGITFEVGAFTNLTNDHLDFHSSLADYAGVKSKLFSNCRTSAINLDDEYADMMISSASDRVMTFAIDDDKADLVAKSVKLHRDKVTFCALTLSDLYRVELRIPGLFSVYNALTAISVMLLLGQDIESIITALKTCTGVKGRAEVVPTEQEYSVIIDYAHTPDALRNIINTVRGFAKGRVVTLFGCGGDRDSSKRPLMGKVVSELSDFVIVTSDNPRTEAPGKIIEDILQGMKETETPYFVIENRREAMQWALINSQPGDTLILAGKGHETYQIIGKEKTHFDEREVVRDILAEISKAPSPEESSPEELPIEESSPEELSADEQLPEEDLTVVSLQEESFEKETEAKKTSLKEQPGDKQC